MVYWLYWLLIVYFLAVNTMYMALIVLSICQMPRYMQVMYQQIHGMIGLAPDSKPPISVVIPACNESQTIIDSVESALNLNYPEFEIIVVDDGSEDGTLSLLKEHFDLHPQPNVARDDIETGPIHGIYGSRQHENLKVVSKGHQGKADALNVGINHAQYPLVCNVDADSVLEKNGLHALVQPFLFDSDVVATGGTIRVINGSEVESGQLKSVGLSWNPLVLFQVIEYLRGFLFGRLGWNPLNGLLIISGSFALYKKDIVVRAGGYSSNTVTEDMELVVRIHEMLGRSNERDSYKIQFVPHPICWTQVPEDIASLKNQRARWQQGLMESLAMNWKLPFRTKNPGASWISYPFQLLFEGFGSVVEIGGYAFILTGYYLGHISLSALAFFGLASVGFGILISLFSFLLEEISFQTYKKPSHVATLFLFAVLENLGYRQMIAVFHIWGLVRVLLRKERAWGEMKTHGFDSTTKDAA